MSSHSHSHANKSVLDLLSDNGGSLEYDGNPISGGAGGVPVITLTSSATDAYAGTADPTIASYDTGAAFVFKANHANTGAATLNIDGLGAKSIVKVTEAGATEALSSNDIRSGQACLVIYDGTNFQLQSALGNVGTIRGEASVNGYTVAEVPATAPAPITFTVLSNVGDPGSHRLTLTIDGISTEFTLSTTDPADSSVWVDTTGMVTIDEYRDALVAAINGETLTKGCVATAGGPSDEFSVECSEAGGYDVSWQTQDQPVSPASGNVSGTAYSPASGAVQESVIIAGEAGKHIRCLRAWVSGPLSATVQLAFLSDATYYEIGPELVTDQLRESEPADATQLGNFVAGIEGADLVLRLLTDPGTLAVSSDQATANVIAEKV